MSVEEICQLLIINNPKGLSDVQGGKMMLLVVIILLKLHVFVEVQKKKYIDNLKNFNSFTYLIENCLLFRYSLSSRRVLQKRCSKDFLFNLYLEFTKPFLTSSSSSTLSSNQ
ncbi:hypothetical protein BpHYR1_004961 [Brachionus plicatilis]|uniref:Uncharacterized protein n=1 Tax=Brachionus plicatilis TaxID=10195 RepID=A0A3M7RJL7_BRAPC|nr:hypothetical protein BpHYR1_004961 [Brachionus plicatilis]